jgi:SAM-dependent methyltransferase
VRDYDSQTYGRSFADVYDDWYAGVSPVEATVARMLQLAGDGGNVLELGVGTGRLAVPMTAAGLSVTGVDASPEMLDVLRRRDTGQRVSIVRGDMVDDLPEGPFDAALVAYNTIFNLLDADRQQACFEAVASRLAPGGRFVVEAFVPDEEVIHREQVTVRSMGVDHVVLSVSRHEPATQRADGQFVEITESGGVRLRPWAIRWAAPGELDAMASAAGFALEHRWADMTEAPFDDDSPGHVTVYRLGDAAAHRDPV